MTQRKIYTLHRPCLKPSQYPPLLFIHGGYVNSACWDVYFLPYFASHGYDCYAVDLSGHGKSEGKECLDSFGLDDFLDDVIQVIGDLPDKPVALGHSMGAVITERLLERSLVRAGVLMAPVPPSGTQASILKFALKHPQFFSEISRVSQGFVTEENLQLMRQVYFSPEMKEEQLLKFLALVQPESTRATVDMMMLGWRFPKRHPKLPVLVIGGELDVVFPPYMVHFVTQRWNAEQKIIPATGHAMILDTHWEKAAAEIEQWLRKI